MEDTIIFLSGVVRFVPKQTTVNINSNTYEIGPSGVKVVHIDSSADYHVHFDEPLQKNWTDVTRAMKDGSMTIFKRDGTINLAPYVANFLTVLR